MAQRDIAALKEGINVCVHSTSGGTGLPVGARGIPSAVATHERLATAPSAAKSDEFPAASATPRIDSDSMQAPKSARFRRPPPGMVSLINATAPVSTSSPVEIIEKPLE
ncbi:hypothetical protein Pmar_PMAR000276 [Perkinsus marinus ATCC 50983]|uniref:Uncharacterized protein n=1 Tax=Perkinsus marinus (strain ATCC 50983 / TXsc) TaxID=423536 RepID=C5LP04_PERM5|nr:hypothetical protein Pmar_PMAR000276 [Perkinsus marinus ATCC 50983]EER01586.1 hypothetical protein Pmar_PMAR000276 [Perkinsus marinus ATCC 50983]|eukprot:XP_002768868.1 hypothetical protein Pmar_PMAR000276 [Perkinsus marinus ATCC 50983]